MVHIYNYAYSFGAGILVYLIAWRQTGSLDITRFSLLFPVVGLPPGFMQNNGSASAGRTRMRKLGRQGGLKKILFRCQKNIKRLKMLF